MRTTAVVTFLVGLAAAVCIGADSAGHIGASPLPSDLDPADVILFEDFDGPTTVIDDLLARDKITSAISSEVAFSGNRSLEMAADVTSKFSWRLPLGGAWDDLHARYMFRIAEAKSRCWGWDEHYKMMGFEAGTEECKGALYKSDGTDCFTVRSRFNYPHLGVHVESAPYPGIFDFMHRRVKANDGEGHCLEFRVKLNTPGEKDGEIHIWVDGRERVKNKLRFRKVESLKIDKWWFTHWSNDAWCAPLYVDDLVISKERIGCPRD